MKISKEITTGLVSVAAVAVGATAADAQNWSGSYAGVALGFAGGEFPFYDGDDYTMSGLAINAFAGYNWETASGIVIGGEVAFLANPVNGDLDENASEPDDYNMLSMFDVKIKVGKGFNNILAYGFVGGSAGSIEAYEGEYNYTVAGTNYGLGAELMVSSKLSIGVEHIWRSLYNSYDEDFYTSNMTSLRVAFRF